MRFPILNANVSSPEVGNWQRFLNRVHCVDWENKPLVVDESFGRRTTFATRIYQARKNIRPTGEVDKATRAVAQIEGFVPFIQAKHFQRAWRKPEKITLVVLHTMEAPEKPSTAENVAAWFASDISPVASAHYCIGSDPVGGVYQCVREADVAFHAPGANSNGVGIEHEGYAKQSPADWQDETSLITLERSAELVAQICLRYAIPPKRLRASELRAGEKGIAGHADVSEAFRGSSHWDPGPSYPWDAYLRRVEEHMSHK